MGVGSLKILVISDTHGVIDKAEDIIKNIKNLDMIIHLGDYFRDAQKLADMFPNIQVEYIYGNSDFMIGDVQAEKLLEINGIKILMTHGHRYSVKWDYNKLCKKAEEVGADLLLFGHTHIADMVKKNEFILLNPGSISDPRDDSSESYAIVQIDEGKIEPNIVFV